MTHHLKCWPEHFDAIDRGEKTAELRLNDRGYQVGDLIVLYKFDPKQGDFVQEGSCYPRIDVRITHITKNFGLLPNYVMLSFVIAMRRSNINYPSLPRIKRSSSRPSCLRGENAIHG